MAEPVILSACRTAIGKFGKSLVGIPAPRLGAIAISESVKRSGIEAKEIDEVIMGNVISAGLGQNPARQSAIYAGVPVRVGALTVNKVCGSGLKAVMLAAQSIKAGDNSLVVAGGMESMSNAPHLVMNLRWGVRYGDSKLVDSMINDGLWDAYNDYHMGITGEVIAKKYGITRRAADEFAYESHMRASNAIREGRFEEEVVPVKIESETGAPEFFKRDECVREDTTLEKLGRLKPVFKKGGVLTAGNSSQLSDGASALVVASREKADELGAKPLARIVGYGTGGTKPELVMEAPIPTTRSLLKKVGMEIGEMDLVEHNEAYATASIAVRDSLGVDERRFNVNGGAVSLGHPIGCSGARVITTLVYALKHDAKKRGLATLCLGGGNAVSMVIER